MKRLLLSFILVLSLAQVAHAERTTYGGSRTFDSVTASTITTGALTATTGSIGALTLPNETASRLCSIDANKEVVSTSLHSWITGTANRITVTNDGDGTVTLTTPQDTATTSSPTFKTTTLSAGNGTQQSKPCMTLYANTTNYANATGSIETAYSYTLPANTLVNNGDWVEVVVLTTWAANANTKIMSIVVGGTGGTTLLTRNTTASGNSYIFTGRFSRTGAATGEGYGMTVASSTTMISPGEVAVNHDWTAAQDILFRVTGTAANDITANNIRITYCPAPI